MGTLKELSDELIKGEAQLLEDSKGAPMRLVDIVVLYLTRGTEGEVLVQTEQIFSDGQKQVHNRLPGTKRRPDENHFITARRILRRQLDVEEIYVTFTRDVKSTEEEKPSPNYPGLRTVYRKRLVRAHVTEE